MWLREYCSVVHRVVNFTGVERYSFPFNFNGNPEYIIKCLQNCRANPEMRNTRLSQLKISSCLSMLLSMDVLESTTLRPRPRFRPKNTEVGKLGELGITVGFWKTFGRYNVVLRISALLAFRSLPLFQIVS